VVALPESLRVELLAGQVSAETVTIQGPSESGYCLDILRIGQVHGGAAGLGAGCGPPGEVLFFSQSMPPVFLVGSFRGLTMTDAGRIFAAGSGGHQSTYEYTSDLEFARLLDHPSYGQPGSPWIVTVDGLAFDDRDATMWWHFGEDLRPPSGNDGRTILVQGNLDGEATGRTIVVPVPVETSRFLFGGAWDSTRSQFVFVDTGAEQLIAADTLGQQVEGYPRPLQQYPHGFLGRGLSLSEFGGMDTSDVWLDVPVFFAGEDGIPRRVVVTDVYGEDLGMETPVPSMPAGWRAGLNGSPIRSRIDPNGVMYGFFEGFGEGSTLVRGLFAWRPVPIPPPWLTLSHWMGTIPASGTSELMLTFRAGQRAPGEYRSTLVVEDTAGVVLASVPLTLVVEADTPAEPGPGAEEGVRLAVSPNPITTTATATLTLTSPASDVRVTVHDVLGRIVETLHATSLPRGTTPLAFNAASLRAGVYVVRALVDGVAVTQRITVLR
jgi:hypothetical protein